MGGRGGRYAANGEDSEQLRPSHSPALCAAASCCSTFLPAVSSGGSGRRDGAVETEARDEAVLLPHGRHKVEGLVSG